jgi:hypothetical protein
MTTIDAPNDLIPRTLRGKLLLITNSICMLMLLLTPFIANKSEIIGIFPYVYMWSVVWSIIWLLTASIIGHLVKR